MKKILFLSTVYPRAYDKNKGIYCIQMLRALASDHQIRVISPVSWVEAAKNPDPEFHGASDSLNAIYPRYFYPPGVLRSKLHLFMWWSIRRRVLGLLEEFRPDVVLSYWAHPDGAVAVRAANAAGVPVGTIVGGSDVLLLPRDRRRGNAVVSSLQACDSVFTVGQDLKEKTIQLGISPDKVRVEFLGIDACFSTGDRSEARRRLSLNPDGDILVWVGRLDPVKGLEVLLSACEILIKSGKRFHLYLVGDGAIRSNIETEIRDRNLSNFVSITGMVPHHSLPDWYRAANLTVLSSHSEGIPNVLRESLACGTPYVATDVGGVRELSNDPAVKLVPPRDPAAFASAVASSLDNPIAPSLNNFQSWREYGENILNVLSSRRSSSSSVRP